jgi:hypothetical protein
MTFKFTQKFTQILSNNVLDRYRNKFIKNLDILILGFFILEILYIFINRNNLTLLNQYELLFDIEEIEHYHLLAVFYFIGFCILYIYATYLLELNLIISFFFFFTSLFLYTEYKIHNNKKLPQKSIPFKDIESKCNTGDIILFQMPYSIPNIIHLLPTIFFGIHHLGIVVKTDNHQTYLLECAYDRNYCHYSKKTKTGVILFDLKERIENSPKNNVMLVKSNMHQKINQEQIFQFIEKHKDTSYMEKDLNCSSMYLELLNECKLLKNQYIYRPIYIEHENFINPDYYNFDYQYEIYKIDPQSPRKPPIPPQTPHPPQTS